jgi:hypothetical protein
MIANKLGSENVTVNCEYTKKNCTKLSFIANTDKIILSVTPYKINDKEIDYDKINLIKKQKQEVKQQKKDKLKQIMIENKDLKAKLINKLKCDKKKENTIENITTNKNIEIIKEEIKEKNENIISKKNKIKTSTHDVMMIQTSLNNIKTTFTDIKSITLTGDLGYLSSKIYKLNNENIQLITPKRKNQKKKNTENERIKLCSRYKIENCFGLLKQYERIMIRKDKKMKTFMSFIYMACTIENNKIINRNKKNQ